MDLPIHLRCKCGAYTHLRTYVRVVGKAWCIGPGCPVVPIVRTIGTLSKPTALTLEPVVLHVAASHIHITSPASAGLTARPHLTTASATRILSLTSTATPKSIPDRTVYPFRYLPCTIFLFTIPTQYHYSLPNA